jgi:CRP/FNR family transcriptional regulator
MTCGNKICPFHELQKDLAKEVDSDLSCLITDAVKQVRFARGDVLFAQGQPSSAVYSLDRGIVKISSSTADGREQIVGISTPGNLLVGLQSMSGDYYEYTAVAETDVAACKIQHRALLMAANTRGEVALRLIASLNAQLAHSRKLMRVMGHKSAMAKIASFISLIIPKAERSNRRFTLPFSRGEMASLLGLSEETVCRQMAEMKRRGILYAPRGNIEILDWEGLLNLADERSQASQAPSGRDCPPPKPISRHSV